MNPTSRIMLTQGDITAVAADAIVNAANQQMLPGSGVCGAIYNAAGAHALADEVTTMFRQRDGREIMCETGDAVVTSAHALNARFIIHTAGPIYKVYEDKDEAADLLASCYLRCIERADQLGCHSVAFPAISTGVYGYPLENAAYEAITAVCVALEDHPNIQCVEFVLFDGASYDTFADALADVDDYYEAAVPLLGALLSV